MDHEIRDAQIVMADGKSNPVCCRCGAALGRLVTAPVCPRCMLASGLSDSNPLTDDQFPWETADAPLSNSPPTNRIGDYELLEQVAHGGMGVVYRARDVRLRRVVALKMILSGQFARPEEVRRFRVEAEAAAKLDHPNIVPVYEVGEQDGWPYYCMKFMEGGPLTLRLAGRARLAPREAAQLLAKVARAVHHAHQRAVLHRDLKPGNILLDRDGEPFVSDFGLAKHLDRAEGLTLTRMSMGSPSYMPPEQATGDPASLSTSVDIYSLGALLYHLLAGRPPFEAPTPQATIQKVLNESVPRLRDGVPELDLDLETICLKCLEKVPRARYASANELAEDLERWLEGRPIQARPSGLAGQMGKWIRRNPWIASMAALLVGSILVGVIGIFIQWQRAESLANQEARLREQAVQAALEARQNLYAADMRLAQQELRGRNLARTWQLLERHAPVVDHRDHDLRGWEWFYMRNQCASEELRLLSSHTNTIVAVRYSADGRRGFSADQFGLIRIWNPEGGGLQDEFHVDGNHLEFFETSPDGRWIAVGVNQRIDLLDAATHQRVRSFDFNQPVKGAAFRPDSGLLAMASNREVVHWDLAGAVELDRYPANVSARYQPGRLAFSPDGRRLAMTFGNRRIGIRNIAERSWGPELPGHDRNTTELAWSPDGRSLASGGMDGRIKVWDPDTGASITNHTAHGIWVTGLSYSPDGTRLASTSADQRLVIWDVTQWREFLNLKGSHGPLRTLAISPDGNRVVTGGDDGQVRLWSMERPPSSPLSGKVSWSERDPILSGDGEWVARITSGQFIALDTRRMEETVAIPLPSPRVTAYAVAGRKGPLCVGTADGQTFLADLAATGSPAPWRLLAERRGQIMQVLFSADGHRLAVVGNDGEIHFYDMSGPRLEQTLKVNARRQDRPCAMSSDGALIAVLTHKDEMLVYETRTAALVLALPEGLDFWDDPVFSPDLRRLAVALDDGWVQVWDLVEKRKVTAVKGQLLHVHGMAFSPDGRRLAMGCGEGTVKLWDLGNFQEVASLEPGGVIRPMLAVAFSPDGEDLIGMKRNAVFRWSSAKHPPAGPAR